MSKISHFSIEWNGIFSDVWVCEVAVHRFTIKPIAKPWSKLVTPLGVKISISFKLVPSECLLDLIIFNLYAKHILCDVILFVLNCLATTLNKMDIYLAIIYMHCAYQHAIQLIDLRFVAHNPPSKVLFVFVFADAHKYSIILISILCCVIFSEMLIITLWSY